MEQSVKLTSFSAFCFSCTSFSLCLIFFNSSFSLFSFSFKSCIAATLDLLSSSLLFPTQCDKIEISSANWYFLVGLFYLSKQPTFHVSTTGFPAKWRLRNECRNFCKQFPLTLFWLKLFPRFAVKFSLQSAILDISASCGTEYKRVGKALVHWPTCACRNKGKKTVSHSYQIQPSWSNQQFWIASHLSVHLRVSAFL